MFLISEFLPGEYVLRTFPLICKGTQSLRFSLSLLAPIQSEDDSLFDFEGKIYGIYSKWQDLEALLRRDHSISALVLEGQFFNNNDNQSSRSSSASSSSTTYSSFSSSSSSSSIFTSTSSFSPSRLFDYFPKLTSLHIHDLSGSLEYFVSKLWKLSLTSLSITNTNLSILDDEARPYIRGDYGPPAFSHTLRSLEICERNSDLLSLLVPYCRNLLHINIPMYDEIVRNNPNLTSLTMPTFPLDFSSPSRPVMLTDLTLHSRLKKLHINNYPFSSRITHPSLQELFLDASILDCVLPFLTQCPALKLLSLHGYDWLNIGKIVGALNPQKGQQLKLDLTISGQYFPSLAEVEEVILRKGIRVNDDFFFQTRDAPQQWRRIMQLAPGLKDMQRLQGLKRLDPYHLFSSSVFSTFQALALLDISTQVEWDEKLLSSLTQTCLTLKVLKVSGSSYQGAFQLHSPSLRTVNLGFTSFTTQFTGFDLDLPNLKYLHLELQRGEAILLQGILDGGNPLVKLPLLRVLSLLLRGRYRFIGAFQEMHCLTGHGSLITINIDGDREMELAEMTFRNLPCLRELTLKRLPRLTHIVLDVPGNCDIYLLRIEQVRRRTRRRRRRRTRRRKKRDDSDDSDSDDSDDKTDTGGEGWSFSESEQDFWYIGKGLSNFTRQITWKDEHWVEAKTNEQEQTEEKTRKILECLYHQSSPPASQP